MRRWAALCLLVAGALSAQQQKERKRRPPELEGLAGLALAAPPEYAADVLLRLAESGRVEEKAWRIELIELAFSVATGAAEPMKRRAFPGVPPETPAGKAAAFFDRNLDAMSLKLRAVRDMLANDEKKARQMWNDIAPLRVEPLACEDALVWDLTAYYETLALVAEHEPKKDIFLLPYVEAAGSPLQLQPLMKLIGDNMAQPLLTAVASALARITGDDRSFSATVFQIVRDTETLAIRALRENLSPYPLLSALPGYLKRHMSAARCVDSVEGHQKDVEDTYVTYYNVKLRLGGYLVKDDLPPLDERDLRPERVEGRRDVDRAPKRAEPPEIVAELYRKAEQVLFRAAR